MSEILLVAAIDFGTTFSGYAFSFCHDYERDPLKISTNTWQSGGNLLSLKTPTTLLLHPNGTFHSFGYDAENKYSTLAENEENQQWFYFKHFKMMLHNNTHIRRSTTIKETNGKEMPAMTVFSLSIKFLKDHLLEAINKCMSDFDENHIRWVLTVPAIWNDAAKQFMREAAKIAGIKREKLRLALEPEAASVYCTKIPIKMVHSWKKGQKEASTFEPGNRYMVLDLGGGTADVTIHEVQSNGRLKEIKTASGGAWGGTRVDGAFYQFLVKLFGNDVLCELKEEHMSDYLDLMRDFETKKRTIRPDSENKIILRLPVTILEIFEDHVEQKLSETLPQSTFASTVTLKRDKLQVEPIVFQDLFKDAVNSIVEHVKDILNSESIPFVPNILLVGGFSESPMVREKLHEIFPDRRIISPDDPGLAVLKGAVMFGFNPKMIGSRKSKCTYGVEVNNPFIPGVHPQQYRVRSYGKWMCSNMFDKFVQVGQSVDPDEVLCKTYVPNDEDAISGIGIYASSSSNPIYITDDSCEKLGTIVLKRPNGGWTPDSKVQVEIKFGETEFTVKITDECLEKTYEDSYDFLQE